MKKMEANLFIWAVVFFIFIVAASGCKSPLPAVNNKPIADAGENRTVFAGDTVQLDGSGSSDADGDILTYLWSFISKPAGSSADFANPNNRETTFAADKEGDYEVGLTVNDGEVNSLMDTVTITAAAQITVYTDITEFKKAVESFGTATIVDFDEIDAGPVNNTYLGREEFAGDTYADEGISFSNPNDYEFYISPGGLFWNTSNSLSVGNFPFDDGNLIYRLEDDLDVSFSEACFAVGFTLVDLAPFEEGEYVRFKNADGNVIKELYFSETGYSDYRPFLGIISADVPVKEINVKEAPDDGDDVNYDDFTFLSAADVDTFLLDDICLTFDGSEERLQNGDFSEGLRHWDTLEKERQASASVCLRAHTGRPFERPGDYTNNRSDQKGYFLSCRLASGSSKNGLRIFYNPMDQSLVDFAASPYDPDSPVWLPVSPGREVALSFWYRGRAGQAILLGLDVYGNWRELAVARTGFSLKWAFETKSMIMPEDIAALALEFRIGE